jgi:hypothetical protein
METMSFKDAIFLIVVPVSVAGLLVFSPRLRRLWPAAGLCLLAACVVAATLVFTTAPGIERQWDQIALFAVLPCGGLLLASRLVTRSGRLALLLLVGPLGYWLGYLAAIAGAASLGYPLS